MNFRIVVKIGTSKYRNSGHYTSFHQHFLRLDLMRVEEMICEELKCAYMYGLPYAVSGVCCFSSLAPRGFSLGTPVSHLLKKNSQILIRYGTHIIM